MKIKVWGSRGSIPSPLKPEAVEEKIYQAIFGMPTDIDTYDVEAVREHIRELPPLMRGTAGGNTSCVEVLTGGERIIIDAGSGIRELGLELIKGPCGQGQGRLHILFSHVHWDHIQGFPFFIPAFIPGNRIFIYSIHDLHTVLEKQQQQPTFPVSLDYMQATIEFIPLEVGKPFSIGKVKINTIENVHPGKAYSFRMEDQYGTFVYANDAEYKQLNDASVKPHLDFFRNADVLIFDAQYTLKEGWQKVDWGHSSAMIGVDLARAAAVKKLILFHHDPTYSDSQLLEIQSRAIAYQAQDKSLPTCEVLVGYEGLTLDLTPPNTAELHLMLDTETAVLTPASVFDERGANQLAQQLANFSEQNALSSSIIDLSQVETLTTASLKSLVGLRQDVQAPKVILAGPSDKISRIIKLAGYEDSFAIYDSVEAALSALQTRESLNLPGQIIKNQYQIESKLGESLINTTLKAIDLRSNQELALKIISSNYSSEAITRLTRQAHQLINLEHKNILKVYTCAQEGNLTFLIEAFTTGKTLADHLKSGSTFAADRALDIAQQVNIALEYAHSRGIVHSDLKPQNIFLSDEGIKISGFGLGRLEEGHNLLEAPILRLSAPYLAPEQILGQAIDARTDLYALGVILYRLFTGRLPFRGDDQEIMQAHLHQLPDPPRELNPNISPSLDHLILKMMAKNPNDRYSSAAQARRISGSLNVGGVEQQHHRLGGLIGREKELQALQSSWEEVKKGKGQLIFISGEEGIGKTTLAQRAAAKSQTSVLLIGRCQELKSSIAYFPFIEMLQSYFATVPPELFDENIKPLLINLTRLAPTIQRILPDLAEPTLLEPKQEQLRLMSTLAQFIKHATQERPWLLILDDLQWVDQSSLELLRYLGHQLPTMALMIIGTYQEDRLKWGHPLQTTLRSLSSYPTYKHYPLIRLDQSGVEQLLSHIWQHPAPINLVEKIYAQTNGNPFYIEEVAKVLSDDGVIVWQEGQLHFPEVADLHLPRSIHEAVWQRIHHLSADTQTLLHQAAILGQTFTLEEIQEMSSLPEWEVLEHLSVAMERQLVQEGAGETNLRFNYTEIQHVLYTDLGPLRRRMLHRRAGEALERLTLPGPEHITEKLAHHFREAGDFDRALIYSIQAARQAEASHANEAAYTWYIQTLEMLDQLNPEVALQFQALRLSVHTYLGQILSLMGRYDDALEHYTLAQTFINIDALSANQSRELAHLYSQTAAVYEKRSEYDQAFIWLEKALNHLDKDEASLELARLYLIGARTFNHQGKLEKAMDWGHKSLTIASKIETSEGKQVMAQTYTRLSAICLVRGYFDVVVNFCYDSIKIYEETGNLAGQVSAYNKLGMAHFFQGDWVKADESYQQSLTISQEIGDIHGRGVASSNMAQLYYNRGEFERAMQLLEQSHTIWQQIGIFKDQGKTLSRMAQIYIDREKWALAQDYLNSSHAIFTDAGSDNYLSEIERRWAQLYMRIGQPNKAMDHIQIAIELATAQRNPLEQGKSYRVLGQIHLIREEIETAETALTFSLRILDNLNSRYEIAKTQFIMAHVAATKKDFDSARNYLSSAIQTFKDLKAKNDLAAAQTLTRELM